MRFGRAGMHDILPFPDPKTCNGCNLMPESPIMRTAPPNFRNGEPRNPPPSWWKSRPMSARKICGAAGSSSFRSCKEHEPLLRRRLGRQNPSIAGQKRKGHSHALHLSVTDHGGLWMQHDATISRLVPLAGTRVTSECPLMPPLMPAHWHPRACTRRLADRMYLRAQVS